MEININQAHDDSIQYEVGREKINNRQSPVDDERRWRLLNFINLLLLNNNGNPEMVCYKRIQLKNDGEITTQLFRSN